MKPEAPWFFMCGIYALRGCEMQKLTACCVKINDRKLVIILFLEGHLLYNTVMTVFDHIIIMSPFCLIPLLVITDIHSGFCMTNRRVGDNGFYYNYSLLDNVGHRCCVGLHQLSLCLSYIMICFIRNNIRFKQNLLPISTSSGISLWFAQLYPQWCRIGRRCHG